MTIPTSLMPFYDYNNDNNNYFMTRIMVIIRTVVLKEIIGNCIIQTFFKYVV